MPCTRINDNGIVLHKALYCTLKLDFEHSRKDKRDMTIGAPAGIGETRSEFEHRDMSDRSCFFSFTRSSGCPFQSRKGNLHIPHNSHYTIRAVLAITVFRSMR